MNHIKNTVLVVDDEPPIRKLLKITLESSHYKCEEAETGSMAIRMAASVRPHLIVLDLGLPDMDGKSVITTVREWSPIPIIVCSVRDEDDEIISALTMGADDYVTKPFNPDILLARIGACLRKSAFQEAGSPDLENGRIRMDLVRHEVLIDGQRAAFTPREYDLLRYLMLHRGKMLTHKQILKDVWGPAHDNDMQYLRVYISQLRDKVEINPSCPHYITTEPGIGYRMETFKSLSEKSEPELSSSEKAA